MTMRTDILIAVIDDDPSVLEAVGNLLEAAGYSVARFDSAESFLAGSTANEFACVISDVGLLGMSGMELQSQLASRVPDLPVILITGRDEWSADNLLGFNNRRFFRKPFDAGVLLSAVAEVIQPIKR